MRKKIKHLRYKKRKLTRKKENTLKKEKVLAADLNYYILQVKSGEIVCNEAKKKLCDDEIQCTKEGLITKW